MPYERISGGDNGLGRSKVFPQWDHFGIWISGFKFKDVSDVRAPPPINGLIRITHHRDVSSLRDQQVGNQELGKVGVLVFVDEQMGPPLGQARAEFGLVT